MSDVIDDVYILSYLLKGSEQFNNVRRLIDINMLIDAIEKDFQPLYYDVNDYFNRHGCPPSYRILFEKCPDDFDYISLISTVECTETFDNEIGHYIDKVRNRKNAVLARGLVDKFHQVQKEEDIIDFNNELAKTLSRIDLLRKSSVFSEGDYTKSVSDRYNRYLYAQDNPNQISGVFTGYKNIDDMTFGIKNSELMIIAGASSSGKSMLMMNMAINAWLGKNNPAEGIIDDDSGKNVVYFSLEMSKPQLEARLDAAVASIRHKALSRAYLTDDELTRFRNILEFQKNYKKHFYVVDLPRGSKTIDIEARYDSIVSEFKPDLVCIDYLGIMSSNKDYGSDWLDVGHVAEDVHEFCRKKNIPVISAAQRKTKNKQLKTQVHDLEELGRSKMLGDNANIVLLIERREDEHLYQDMIVHIVKNRDGELGTVKLSKDFERSKISDIPLDWISEKDEEV